MTTLVLILTVTLVLILLREAYVSHTRNSGKSMRPHCGDTTCEDDHG